MTVAELREKLKNHPDDMLVVHRTDEFVEVFCELEVYDDDTQKFEKADAKFDGGAWQYLLEGEKPERRVLVIA